MTLYSYFAIVMTVSCIVLGWFVGYFVFHPPKAKSHISGRLVIDTTGDKDRWTIFFDDDLGDVEKMDKVILRIERIE